ncbi:MAG: c-type cytochrome domain-containing protein, partial [Bryobacteraceae bacterium]
MNLRLITVLTCAAGLLSAAAPDAAFEEKIRPILAANCQACHSSKTKTSGFAVTDAESVIAGGNKHGRAVIQGDAANSPLIKILKGHLSPRMPFGAALPDADIAQIENWITHLKAQPVAAAPGDMR